MLIGIDLGTTNSLAGVWRDGRAELIPNALGEYLTPSAVSLSDRDELLIGRAARDRLITHPDRTAHAFKRFMGSDRTLRLGSRSFRPEELSALVLRALKEDAEHHLGEPVAEAVISVPAYFNDTQRKATRLAGELAGLKVERLINEPTAAAIAYGLHHSSEENRFLVFDLGGGTFDVSILEMFDGVMEVHASAGDNYLGGEDFVEVLVDGFLREHGLSREALATRELHLLRAQMESAKRTLNSGTASARLSHGGRDLIWQVTPAMYEELARPLLERLRLPVERAMRDAGLRVSEINEVILAGGSTRKLVVQKLVARMFGRLPLRQINPDEVVALGAAVQAGLTARDAALAEVVMTDVCPYTLGVEVSSTQAGNRQVDGLFSPIIERNTIVPASRVETFHPLNEFQEVVLLNIYQGEAPFVKDNVFLGALRVPLPKLRKQEAGVDVRFTYDVNGLLEVEATVLASGERSALLIEQNKGSLTPEEVAERLARLSQLKIHPREEADNQAILARAERLFVEALDEERSRLGSLIAQFVAVLEGQKPHEIHRARVAFKELLDRLDHEGGLPL